MMVFLFGLKQFIYTVFYDFSLILTVFININDEYLICISDHGMKDLCLRYDFVPSLEVFDK